MFDNIGGKIKGVARVVTWLGIISSCLAGFVMLVEGLDTSEILAFYGILVAGVGSLFSWLGSLTLYGLGQLIENSDILVKQGQMRQPQAPAAPAYAAPAYGAPAQAPAYAAPAHYCTTCGSTKVDGICHTCHRDALDSLNRGLRDGFITEAEYRQRLEELKRG